MSVYEICGIFILAWDVHTHKTTVLITLERDNIYLITKLVPTAGREDTTPN